MRRSRCHTPSCLGSSHLSPLLASPDPFPVVVVPDLSTRTHMDLTAHCKDFPFYFSSSAWHLLRFLSSRFGLGLSRRGSSASLVPVYTVYNVLHVLTYKREYILVQTPSRRHVNLPPTSNPPRCSSSAMFTIVPWQIHTYMA